MPEREGMSRRGKQYVEYAKRDIEDGRVDGVNMLMSKVKVPEKDKLDLLARAYDRKAEIGDEVVSSADKSVLRGYLIPPWELQAIGDRAIAAELRRRKAALEEVLPQE